MLDELLKDHDPRLAERVRRMAGEVRTFSCHACRERKPAWAFAFDYRRPHDRADVCTVCCQESTGRAVAAA